MKSFATHIDRSLLRLLIVAACIALCCNSAVAQLFLNGKPAFSDSLSNVILYSIPEQYFGNDFTAIVQADTTCGWDNITVAGKPLTHNPITFEDIDGGKAYLVRAIKNGKPIVKRLMFTFLPIINIEGNISNDVINTSVTLVDPDGGTSEAMTAQVKWRGGYTNLNGRHKRNYSIKLIDANGEKMNRKLLGLRRDNHWKLDAAQVDLSRVRNRVATDLWLDMARPPYYIDLAPDALSGARGKMVEVLCNGKYMGIYSLMECIDRKQLQVKKWDEDTKKINGMIWNAESWSKVAEFKNYVGYNNNSPYYSTFLVEYPDFEDIHPTNHLDLYNAVKFMSQCDVESYNEHVHKYFDMPVIIDYAIFNQLLIAVDNGVNNIYWAIYDRNVDKRLTLAVWDLDWSLGTNRDAPDFRGGRAEPDFQYRFSSKEFLMLQDPACTYHNDMVERYWQLRQSWLSDESLANRVNTLVDHLIKCGAVAREETRWSHDSDINGLTLDIDSERHYIIDWMKKRLAFLDHTLMRRSVDPNADGVLNSADLVLVNRIIQGTTEATPQADANGDGVINSADLTLLYKLIMGY